MNNINYLLKAMHDPSSVYDSPMDILEDNELTREQKIKILRQWEYDAKELEVADQENMLAANELSSPGILQKQVLIALHALGEKAAA